MEKKLNREADKLSYQDKIPFFIKSDSKITKSIPENYESWNEEKISARQRQLAKDAKSIWRIQELSPSK